MDVSGMTLEGFFLADYERDQQRQQQRRLLWRNVKVMTVVWAVVGVGMLIWAFVL